VKFLSNLMRAAAFCVVLSLGSPAVYAGCLDTKPDTRLNFEGKLYFQVFPGPPNYEAVNKGDTPEPTYILKLDHPVCVDGNDSNDAIEKADQVQIFPNDAKEAGLFISMRRLAGRRVRVEGTSAFTAHTGHHHAPLLLPIAAIVETSDPGEAEGGGLNAVQEFYLALAKGNGADAARLVVAEKRASGPLSAPAMTAFYGGLDEMLALMEVKRFGPDEFQVRYGYVGRGDHRCDGTAVVRTNGQNQISSIKPLNGC
jgi:hypothetical protein